MIALVWLLFIFLSMEFPLFVSYTALGVFGEGSKDMVLFLAGWSWLHRRHRLGGIRRGVMEGRKPLVANRLIIAVLWISGFVDD